MIALACAIEAAAAAASDGAADVAADGVAACEVAGVVAGVCGSAATWAVTDVISLFAFAVASAAVQGMTLVLMYSATICPYGSVNVDPLFRLLQQS